MKNEIGQGFALDLFALRDRKSQTPVNYLYRNRVMDVEDVSCYCLSARLPKTLYHDQPPIQSQGTGSLLFSDEKSPSWR